jgi:uncharacterized membrane protein
MSEKRLSEAARPMPEQITYANLLFLAVWVSIFLLIVTYFAYVIDLVSPYVPIEVVQQNWTSSVGDYLHTTNAPHGWGWLRLLDTGDYLNFIGLATLALVSILCYLVLLPGYIRRKDWLYTMICVLEVLVLSLAASGILGSGGH